MNPTQLIALMRRTWVIVLSCLVIGLSIGAIVAFTSPARYTATSAVYVAAQGASDSAALTQGANFARQAITSYTEVATTTIVLEPVIQDLGMDTTVAGLAARLEVSAPPTAQVISITASDAAPTRAAQIANAVAESLATAVRTQLERPAADGHADSIRVTMISPARVPVNPSAPNVPLIILLGGVLGLAAGFGFAVVRALLDTRVHAVADAERATGSPVVGGVMHDPELQTRPLVVRDDPRSPQAEAFRRMRTNVRFVAIDETTPAIVFTSAGVNEGKSTTCMNLALAFAETGARVALIDADLRDPSIARTLGIDRTPGLSDVLAGQTTLASALQRWGSQKLFVLPAGTTPPNPSELLGASTMSKIINALRDSFDVVIIDTPPLLAVTDAALVASAASGAVLVAASGSTRIPQLEAAVRALETAHVHLLGVVLTKLPTSGPDSNSYAQYTYGALHASR